MAAKNGHRSAIPESVKREVRKRCCFGCVICGAPIFHYDHIRPYSTVKAHTADNLTLLCPNHHQSKTSGVLPEVVVANFNARPFNTCAAYTSGDTLHSFGMIAELKLGSILATFDFGKYPDCEGFAAIAVDGTALVGAQHEDGNLLLFMYGADHLGRDLFVIERGELIVSTAALDFQREGRRFIIREETDGHVALDFLKADNGFTVNAGLVCHKGRRVMIDTAGIRGCLETCSARSYEGLGSRAKP